MDDEKIEILANQIDTFLFKMKLRPESWAQKKRQLIGRDPHTYEDHVELYNAAFRMLQQKPQD